MVCRDVGGRRKVQENSHPVMTGPIHEATLANPALPPGTMAILAAVN